MTFVVLALFGSTLVGIGTCTRLIEVLRYNNSSELSTAGMDWINQCEFVQESVTVNATKQDGLLRGLN